LDTVTEVLSPGHVFHGRYEVVRCLKSGGMGAVYEVIHKETCRRRALKVMLPSAVEDPEMLARFQREARIAANIESEHIVETFDAGVDEDTGAPFLVMELLRGEDLAAMLARCGALQPDVVVGILSQVASALVRTHAAGVVHRDLKPENIFASRRDDGAPKIKILDFGIAKVVAVAGKAAGRTRILGTPLYMSPEQIRGDGAVSTRADLYALGHVAFTLLVGRAYWEEQARRDELYALMMKIAGGGGPAATAMAARCGVVLPAGFDVWFARATAPDPASRFQGAPELVEALAGVLGVPPGAIAAPFAWPAERRPTPVPTVVAPAQTTRPVVDSLESVASAPVVDSVESVAPTLISPELPSAADCPSLAAPAAEPCPPTAASPLAEPDTAPTSSPPVASPKPTPAPRARLRRAGWLLAGLGLAVAAVVATRLEVFHSPEPGVTRPASAAGTSSPLGDGMRPAPPGDVPSARPGAAAPEGATSPRAEKTARDDVAASLSTLPKPRPVRPVATASAQTTATVATPVTTTAPVAAPVTTGAPVAAPPPGPSEADLLRQRR
jgi:serine/threonine-protein kinase